MSLEPEVLESVSLKPDAELLAIIASPDDWVPAMIDRAHAELSRRGVEITRKPEVPIEQQIQQSHARSIQSITGGELFWTIVSGVIGLIGLTMQIPQASRFNRDGYFLKAQQSWRVYWTILGMKFLAIVVYIAVTALTT